MLYTRSLSQDVIFKCYFADVSFAEFFVFFYSSGLEILFVNSVGGNTQFHVCQRRGSPDTLLPFGLIFPSSQVLGATGHPKDVQDYLPEVGGVPAEWGWAQKSQLLWVQSVRNANSQLPFGWETSSAQTWVAPFPSFPLGCQDSGALNTRHARRNPQPGRHR